MPMGAQFGDFKIFYSVKYFNEKSFCAYKSFFPPSKMFLLTLKYTCFDTEQLLNELTNVYSDDVKNFLADLLLKYESYSLSEN